MRGTWIILFTLAMALCLASGEQNPLTNGGFETLDANGFPVDWSRVGPSVTVTEEAHTGRYALRFDRGTGRDVPPEIGLNRDWRPNSGEQGAMLAQTKGGIIFWYKILSAAPDADISIQVIPMNARAWEDTGEPRTIRRLPNTQAADGAWHEGRLTYDYSANPKVKWVHVGVRLTGGAAVLLVDDMQYVERVGPVLQIEKVHLYPDAKRPDKARLTASVTNLGDAPTGAVQVRLSLPPGLKVDTSAPDDAGALRTIETLVVNGGETCRWNLSGALRPGAIRLEAAEGDSRTEYTLPLRPRPEILSFLVKPGLAPPGAVVEAEAVVWNRGTAALEGAQLRLHSPSVLRLLSSSAQALPPTGPGRRSAVRWRMRVPAALTAHALLCDLLTDGGEAIQSARAAVEVTDALTKEGKPFGPLRIRTGTDRTMGEILSSSRTGSLARLPHLGKVVTRLPDGSVQTLYARYGAVRTQGQRRGMEAQARDRRGGVWRFRATSWPARSGIGLSIQVSCSRPRTLLLFEGPMLLAGDGSTGAVKQEAILPGLEWLTAQEVSSSDLDIAAGHPDRLRFVPHPNKVTIPAMGVKTPRAALGLLWDVHQRWDGTHDRPQPVFAVPDRLGGTAAHRMGLIAPNVLTGLPENSLRAQPGYALPPRQTITLSATLYAEAGARDALSALDAWFRLYKPDPVLPAPQGSDTAQIAWSMAAYLQSLWVSPQEGWLPFQGGPGIWRTPRFGPDFAYDLLQASRILPDHPDAKAWRARLEMVRPHIPQPGADDLGTDQGDPITAVHFLAARAAQLISAQNPDGSWGFDADRRDTGVFKGMDYHELGPPGGVEVGTCARNAYEILLYARISGDQDAYRAGVRALEYIRRFTVPRAAQVWEVPFHTPDILAAADAVDAYLEAFRFTRLQDGKGARSAGAKREARWLREARRWARAGLPFVYGWSAPGKPWMRYGSIPVFGATWYQGSWFGNIVQWNGLRYAYAVLKLQEVDSQARYGGLSWRDIALGVTRCAMYQQSTKPGNLALWPDSYHTITDARAQWDFAPRLILKNVYALLGRDEEPQTYPLDAPGGGVVRLTTRAAISAARWSGDTMRIVLQPGEREGGRLLIAGVTPPTFVAIGGRVLAEESRPSTAVAMHGQTADALPETGYRYDPTHRLLVIHLPKAYRAEITVRGCRPAAVRTVGTQVTRIDFSFDRDAEGWFAANHLEPLRVENGALLARTTGGDPYMQRVVCRIPGSRVRTVTLRIRGGGDGGGQFYWTTAASPAFDEVKTLRFAFPTDGEWHEVSIPVGDHPHWRGQTITGLRIDPGSTPGVEIAIDWLRGE